MNPDDSEWTFVIRHDERGDDSPAVRIQRIQIREICRLPAPKRRMPPEVKPLRTRQYDDAQQQNYCFADNRNGSRSRHDPSATIQINENENQKSMALNVLFWRIVLTCS
jgi:hypothetical protein